MAVAAEAPARPAAVRRPPAWAPTAAVLFAYLGLAFALFAPVWAHPSTTLIGNQFDSGPHTWFVAWPSFALGHRANPLLSAWIGAPQGANMAWNAAAFVQSLAVWPVAALAGPVVAFNLVMTLGPALTAFFSHLVLRRWVSSPVAAAAGGLLVGFSPYLIAHEAAGHANLVTAFPVPLTLLLLDSLLVRQRRSPWLLGGLLGLLAAVQVYAADEEVVAGAAMLTVAGLAILAAVAPAGLRAAIAPRMWRRLLRGLVVAVPVCLALAAPLLWMQFAGPQHLVGAVRPSNRYVTDLANLVVPTRIQAVAPAAATAVSDHFSGNLGEAAGYLGLPLIAALLAVTAWQWRRLVVRWAACLALVAMVLSLGPTLHVAGHDTRISLPWRVLDHLPLYGSALTARFMLYAFLLCGVLVAAGVEALIRERRRSVQAAGAALLALSALALAPALPLASRPTATPAFFTSAAVRSIPPDSVAYLLPLHSPEPMLWQAISGMRFRMVGGWYLGPDATGHVRNGPAPTPLSDALTDIENTGTLTTPSPAHLALYRQELRRDHVQSIILTSYEPHAPVVAEFLQDLTGTPPHDDAHGTLYWTNLTW